jgi:hypothetical protein
MIISILLLTIPTLYHLWSDRNGEAPEEKTQDIIIVCVLAVAASLVGFFIADRPIVDGLILAWAVHFFIFDYAIVWLLKKRGVIEGDVNVFEHLGKSYTDDVLRQFTPWWRFVIKLTILVSSVTVYFL